MDKVATDKRWLVITVGAPSDADKEALTEGLLSLGGTSVEESGLALTTYVNAPADLDGWLGDARLVLGGADIEWRWQDNQDWSETWKRGLRPRRVGHRLIVAPSWSQPEVAEGDIVITVDPEMAFGTGEHATTRAALRAIESVVKSGDLVLDVGTGSAILAIAAALLGARHVIAVDNDEDALINARDNISRNRVANAVQLERRLVDKVYLATAGEGRFDVIAANVLSSVLEPLLEYFALALRPGGYLVLGGILEQEADDMLDASEAAGFTVVFEDLEDEWWGVLLQKPIPAG